MKKLIIFLAVLAVLCGGFYAAMQYFETNVYSDSEEFRSFADRVLRDNEICKADSNATVDYDYDKSLSFAVRYDADTGEDVSKFRDNKISNAEDKCKLETVRAERERIQTSDETKNYRPLKHACIIDSAVRKADNGAITLYVYTRTYVEDKKDMVLDKADVDTYIISDETSNEIDPTQALNVNYRAKAAKYASEYFDKRDDENMPFGWSDYISDSDSNFNKFIITDSAIIFCFDQGTVADESEGIVSMKVPLKYMEAAVRPKLLERFIDPNKPMVAVTYDDGPGGESEARILKCLEENDAVATFFYQGYMIEYNKQNVLKAQEIGCEIGNHSWDHPVLSMESDSSIKKTIEKTNAEIKDLTGNTPELIRPPYGDYSDRVNKIIKKEGMASILWSIDTLDWKTRNPKKIFKSVKNDKDLDGDIILMHSIYDTTASASEKIIPWLHKHGYQTVTVSELIKYKAHETPVAGKVYRELD